MSEITENLKKLLNIIPNHVKLVAVSKFKPVVALMEAYNIGHKVFGENYVQELAEKYEQMPKDIEWHFIGHLQTNKVKYIAQFVGLIHSVDSLKLLTEINKQAKNNNRVINCLLQIYIANEDTKTGFEIDKIKEIIENINNQEFNNIKIVGLMGMSTFTNDLNQIRSEFKELKKVFESIKINVMQNNKFDMQVVSMGMSNDWQLAVEEGSNLVRIGSSIFGARNI
jgi:PLP dependent protein